MHTWEMMPPTNYDNNWCTTTVPIKSEPQDMHTFNNEPKPIKTDSNGPTSPQSMDSIDSTHHNNYFTTEHPNIHSINNMHNVQNIHRPLGFNPLTPPGYPNAILPPHHGQSPLIHHHHSTQLSQTQQHHQQQQQHQHHSSQSQTTPPFRNFTNKSDSSTYAHNAATLTPSLTPPIDDTPPKSPKYLNETPEKDLDNMSNSDDESPSIDSDGGDETDIRMPKVNSHGKVKTFKCKQCDYVAVTKMTFWEHTKAHIKPEKVLKCPKCPFVTEYKHHLEYHLRNHDGSKPFNCNKCTYSCVNKSMLNSHLKSHSNIYQYRCSDCSYATKYCHSLKLHLRKYSHKPAMVLNQDGSPNPLPIIDVYGTRRGPKTRPSQKQQERLQQQKLLQQQQQQLQQQQQQDNDNEKPELQQHNLELQQQQHHHQHQQQQHQQQQQLQNLLPTMLPNPFTNMLHHGTNMSLFPYLNLNFHQMFAAQQRVAMAQLSPSVGGETKSTIDDDDIDDSDDHHHHLRCHEDDEDHEMNEPNNNDDSMHSNTVVKQRPDSPTNKNPAITTNNISMRDTMTPIKDRTSTYEESECSESKITTSMLDDNDERYTKSMIDSPHSTPSISKNRRKGRAFKLDTVIANETDRTDSSIIDVDDDESSAGDGGDEDVPSKSVMNKKKVCLQMDKSVPITNPQSPTSSVSEQRKSSNDDHQSNSTTISSRLQDFYECKYCEIAFKDAVLYTIHKGYHGYNDVFKCNMCGEKCDDRVSFFLHIARNSHS